jgi:hypothetical protein
MVFMNVAIIWDTVPCSPYVNDISEESITSIFLVEFPYHLLHAGFWLGWFSALKTEVVLSCGTSVHLRTTRRYIPEDNIINDIVTCLTEGNDRIRDTVAPFLVTVTIGLYGYEANNGMRGYVAFGESAHEVSLRQLVAGVRSAQPSKWDVSAVQCSSDSRIQEATSAKVFTIIVICIAAVIAIENKSGNQSEPSSSY